MNAKRSSRPNRNQSTLHPKNKSKKEAERVKKEVVKRKAKLQK